MKLFKRLGKQITLFFEDVIYQRKKGVVVSLLQPILLGLSFFWAAFVSTKNFLYRHVFSNKKVGNCVVSIGNIAVGGTGKTPLTILLAKQLIENNIKISVLSRGYKSFAEKNNENVLVHFEEGAIASWHHIGDEPAIIAKSLPSVVVVVGKDRVKSAIIANRVGAQVTILDDGLQYRKLKKDFEIVAVNPSDIINNNYFIPRGVLREPLSSIARADIIVVNNCCDQKTIDKITEKTKKYTNAPIIATEVVAGGMMDLYGNVVDVSLKDVKVGAFCAIASPSRFYGLIEKMGGDVISTLTHIDHGMFEEEEIKKFADKAVDMGAKFLVCTEKDSIKLSSKLTCSLTIYVVKIELKIIIGNDAWKNLVEKIRYKVNT
jgi:tetraacyldisaccharide 4'-kinase